MIALDISLLNLKSPYYVVQDADGDLLFEIPTNTATSTKSVP